MKRSDRMKMVMKLAKNDEQVAARQLSQVRQSLDEQVARLDELSLYRDQYSTQLGVIGDKAYSAREIGNSRVFVAQLGAAINQQKVVVEQFQSKFSHYHQEWIGKRTHTQAVEKLIERYKNDELSTENSREQKLLDEFAMRLGFKISE